MKVAFIADPLAGFKTYKDSTFAMMEAAAARGRTKHQLVATGQGTIDIAVVVLGQVAALINVKHAPRRVAVFIPDEDVGARAADDKVRTTISIKPKISCY